MSPEAATNTSAEKRRKHRSPSYPAVDLRTAIERARQLQRVAGAHPARVATVAGAWGYTAMSSNGLVTIAALKKYGLLEEIGSGPARELKLTRLGRELTFFAEETSEWVERAQVAALKPMLYKRLWVKYGPELPADSVMLPHLVFDLGFSEAAAQGALRRFRSSVEFARLADAGARVAPDEPDERGDFQASEEPLSTPTLVPPPAETPPAETPTPQDSDAKRESRTVQVTYSPTEWALLQARFPMSEDDWEAMIDVLQAMKRGLVTPRR